MISAMVVKKYINLGCTQRNTRSDETHFIMKKIKNNTYQTQTYALQ